ncbi:MAG TPA: hypothetical protein VH660_07280, partial [Candidatus Deferrimicrobiaceae bacterium]
MKICPTKEEFREHAKTFSVIPVWHEFHADLETPVSAYLKIASKFPDDHFLLESVEGGEKWARYSFIGFDPYLRYRADGKTVSIRKGNAESTHPAEGDPLRELEGFLSGIRYHHAVGLPRLSGGAVGFIGYDYVRHIEKVPDTHPEEGTPDALFLFPSRLVIFDNVKHTILIVAHGEVPEAGGVDEAYGRCCRSIEEVRAILQGPLPWSEIPRGREGAEPVFDIPRDAFLSSVRKAKEYIRDGEIIQAVLSNRARMKTDRSP